MTELRLTGYSPGAIGRMVAEQRFERLRGELRAAALRPASESFVDGTRFGRVIDPVTLL